MNNITAENSWTVERQQNILGKKKRSRLTTLKTIKYSGLLSKIFVIGKSKYFVFRVYLHLIDLQTFRETQLTSLVFVKRLFFQLNFAQRCTILDLL